jgi:hypothetical protein
MATTSPCWQAVLASWCGAGASWACAACTKATRTLCPLPWSAPTGPSSRLRARTARRQFSSTAGASTSAAGPGIAARRATRRSAASSSTAASRAGRSRTSARPWRAAHSTASQCACSGTLPSEARRLATSVALRRARCMGWCGWTTSSSTRRWPGTRRARAWPAAVPGASPPWPTLRHRTRGGLSCATCWVCPSTWPSISAAPRRWSTPASSSTRSAG